MPVSSFKPITWRRISYGLTALAALLLSVATLRLVLTYRAAGADTPNVTDWMQGWGSLLAVLFSALAVFAAGAVYLQGKAAARVAEERWRQERAEAAEAAREAEQRWRDDREAMDRRWHEELAQLQRSATANENSFQLRQRELEEATLRQPRLVRALRVGTEFGQLMRDHMLVGGVFVTVLNAGDEPVTSVNALITYKPDGVSFGATKQLLAAGSADAVRWEARPEPLYRLSARQVPLYDFDSGTPSPEWSVTIHFTDAANRTWRRVDNGAPVQVPDGQLP
jgi:hypothetical protein